MICQKKRFLSCLVVAISSATTGIFASASVLPPSYGGGCVLASKKIYCYGGSTTVEGYLHYTPTANFFSLDVSGPISTADNSSSWQIASSNGDILPTANIFFGIASLPSSDGFVISGGMGYYDGNPLPYQTLMYNATNGTWSSIQTNFLQTAWNALATDYKGRNLAFMYGGRSFRDTGYRNTSEAETYPPQGKILSYHSSIFNWAIGADKLLPNGLMSGRIRHSAVQGADGKFYIIGGEYSQYTINNTNVLPLTYSLTPANMSEVLVYDISTGWTTVATNGAAPSSRWHHSATLLSSGRILVLGGCQAAYYGTSTANVYMIPSSDFAYTLDTNTMTWSDQTSAIRPGPDGVAISTQQIARCLHQSVLVGEESLFILNGRVNLGNFANLWLILNTSSWELSNSFSGLNPAPEPTNNTEKKNPTEAPAIAEPSPLSGGAIGGIVVGIVLAIILIIIGGILYWRKRRTAAQHSSENGGNLHTYSNEDSTSSPLGYTDASRTTMDETNTSVSTPQYIQAIKPDGNQKSHQRIVMSVVKPDGV